MQPWETIDQTPRGDFNIFKVRRDHLRSPGTGKEHHFHIIEAPDWVNVIPVTPEGKVVLIRQYRHGTEEITLEVPGGMVDPGDDDPAVAGARELREETGYTADAIVPLGPIAPNPSMQTNVCYSYLALGARPTDEQNLDQGEEIEVDLVDLDDLSGLVMRGKITHSLVVVAFYLFDQYRQAHPDTWMQANQPERA